MDSIAQLKTSAYELLTSDAELQTLFGGTVSMENVWPSPDQVMPYICYRASSTPFLPGDIVAVATLTIDLWDNSDDGSRIAAIRQRVSKLLERRTFTVNRVSMRLRKSIDQEMEEDERYVWHTVMTWTTRYTRQDEMNLED